MHSVFEKTPAAPSIPIRFATNTTWEAIRDSLPATERNFALASGFAAKPGKCLILPAPHRQIGQVIFGLDDARSKLPDPFRTGALPGLLPPGTYRFANAPDDVHLATLAFALGSYRFSRYRKAEPSEIKLVPPDDVDVADIER